MKYLFPGSESERLRFRLLEDNDFDEWLPIFSTVEAEKYLGLADIPTPEERCRKWFEKVNHRYNSNLGGMHVLIDKQQNKFIGQAGLLVQEVDNRQELEIGYSILPAYWGKGYATEAAIRLKQLATEHRFSKSLISIIHIHNLASQKVAHKNGMQFEKQTVFKKMPVNIYRVTLDH